MYHFSFAKPLQDLLHSFCTYQNYLRFFFDSFQLLGLAAVFQQVKSQEHYNDTLMDYRTKRSPRGNKHRHAIHSEWVKIRNWTVKMTTFNLNASLLKNVFFLQFMGILKYKEAVYQSIFDPGCKCFDKFRLFKEKLQHPLYYWQFWLTQ